MGDNENVLYKCGNCSFIGDASEVNRHVNLFHTFSENETIETNNVTEESSEIIEDDAGTCNKIAFRWTFDETKFLISEYAKIFGENKKRDKKKTTKSLYMQIAKNCNMYNINVSWEQVDSKIKGLLKTYKSIKDNNKASGRGSINWPYFTLLDEIIGHRPEVTPVAVASSSSISSDDHNENNTVQINKADEYPNKKRKRTQRTLNEEPEWFKKFREDTQQRHEERMNILTELTNTLKKFAG